MLLPSPSPSPPSACLACDLTVCLWLRSFCLCTLNTRLLVRKMLTLALPVSYISHSLHTLTFGVACLLGLLILWAHTKRPQLNNNKVLPTNAAAAVAWQRDNDSSIGVVWVTRQILYWCTKVNTHATRVSNILGNHQILSFLQSCWILVGFFCVWKPLEKQKRKTKAEKSEKIKEKDFRWKWNKKIILKKAII